MADECYLRNISFILWRFLTNRKILRHGVDGFTSAPKEVVPRIIIALINPSSSAGFKPENLGSNGKQANQ
jgi:hypothetical protein